ncbi:MAG: PAS domain-containing protein [Lamprobacter sp.]|uniref:PAS domain-containing protein n=1 Tax=Lamprobacter sp. TaxID=3100796 RepID=UPI002B25B11D|nr:PAS domain-containing protein [Lamprobacter sp.]MEA3639100.1 PAS domain-containing protein [Lamprobacter sp.]
MSQAVRSLPLLLALLVAAAAAGGFFCLPLPFGLYVSCGLVPVLLALVWLGLPAALLAAVALSGSAWLAVGEHPFGVVLIGALLLFVQALSARARRAKQEPLALPVLVVLFWATLGIPLSLFQTLVVLNLGLDTALLLGLENAANDIIAATLAELVLLLVPLLRQRPASLSNRHLLFVLFTVVALLPTLTLTHIGTRDLQDQLETELAQHLRLFAAAAEELLRLESTQVPAQTTLEQRSEQLDQLSERLVTRLAKHFPASATPTVELLPLSTQSLQEQALPVARQAGLQLVNTGGEPPTGLFDWYQVRYRFTLPLPDVHSLAGLRIEVSSAPLINKVHTSLQRWLAALLGWAAMAVFAGCWLSRWLMQPMQDLIQTAEALPRLIDSGHPMPTLPANRLQESVTGAQALIAISKRLEASFTALAEERDRQREQRALSDLHADILNELVTTDTDEHQLTKHLCQRISQLTPNRQCTLLVRKPEGTLEVLAASDLDDPRIVQLNARLAQHPRVCVHRDLPCTLYEAFESAAETPSQPLDSTPQGPLETCWCQPIQGQDDRILGVITLTAPQPDTTDRFASILLQHAAALAATVLSSLRLRRDHQVMLDALSQAETGIVIAERHENGDFPISFVSQGFESLTGYSAAEVLGRDCRLLQGNDRDQPGRFEIRAALDEGRACQVTLRNYRKDGRCYWNSVTITPVKDARGQIRHFLGIQRNDTERIQAMEQLSASEARLRELTETIAEVFWVFDLEQDRLTYLSSAFEAIWERPIAEAYADRRLWRECIHPEDRERIIQGRLEMATGSGSETVEYRILTPAGQTKWIGDHRFLVRDAHGQPCRIVGVAAEISERKAAEQALEEQRQRLEQIIDGTRVGTWDWRIETDENHCNERWAEMLGYRLAELQPITRHTWRQLVHPDDLPLAEQQIQAHVDGKSVLFEAEFRMRHQAGHWIWIQSTGRLIERGPDGRARRFIGIHLEITERKQAELQLIAQERLERELVALTRSFVDRTQLPFDALMEQTLAKVGQLTGADRAYLFQVDSGGESFSNTYEWVAAGIQPMKDSLQGLPISHLGPLPRLLAEAEAFVVPKVAELGDDWTLLRQDLERQQIQSLLVVPLMEEGALIGFVGLDAQRQQRDWTSPDLNLLIGLAGALVGALQRERFIAELRASTERYDALASQSRMMTWEIDCTGRYTYVNPVTETLLGYPVEELKGNKAFYDLIPEPERAEIKAEAFALIQQQQPWRDFQCPMITADGGRLWVSVDGLPILDTNGRLLGYRGSSLDISDLRHAENQRRAADRALQRYSQDLERLVDLSNQELDANEEIVALLQIANDALGMAAAETGSRALGGHYQRLACFPAISVEPSGVAARAVTEVLFADPAKHLNQPEVILGKAVPKTIRVQGYCSMILLASGWPGEAKPQRWLLTQFWGKQSRAALSKPEQELLRFINQRMATIQHEAELERDLVSAKEQETIGHLASGVAHDFNNVLAVLDANLYFLRSFIKPSEPDAEISQVLDEMSSVLGQAKVITSGMLALSRAGGVPLRPTPLEPPLTELSDILRMMLPESIDWQLEVEPGLTATTNGGFLQAALLNLALNGRDAMPEGGRLRIIAQREHWRGFPILMVGDLSPGEYAIIHVSDTGSGIPAAVLNRMFEPLFSTKTQQRGHGLGLFMVREFVLHSGSGLSVQSNPGQGTKMQILMPLAKAD